MRKSVEHLGPQHEIQDIVVAPGVIMRICPEFEQRRYEFMKPLLLAHALKFPPSPFNSKYPALGLAGRCYDQAMGLVSSHPELTYCEGVIFDYSETIAMPHGWCLDTMGRIVDPTAYRIQNNPNLRYVGIPFKTTYAIAWFLRYGFHGMLDGHPRARGYRGALC